MKPLMFYLLCIIMLQVFATNGQPNKIPYAELYTLDGIKTDTRAITNEQNPLILVIWKSYDKDCCENLFTICDIWKEKLKSKGVKMVAVCTDCVGKTDHIKPFVFGHGIDAQIFIDKNGDFKRKMGISDGPFTILYDKNMEVYCKYSGYCNGVDEALCEKVNKCLDGIALNE